MGSEYLQALIEWVAANPLWSGAVLFLIAMSESLAVIGVLVPGVAIMFGIGALIGAGVLEFWSMLMWAAAGAATGDGLSFWLGRHFRGSLREMWPLRKHPSMLEQGEAFFCKYGAKSIVFGRFVGPVRAVVPMVAGMMNMGTARYITANIASALAWAPAYLIPGMLFGVSLQLAAEVAGRLVAVLILVLAVGWFVAWLVRHLFNLLQPRAHRLVNGIVRLGRDHPALANLSASLADPQHSEARGLAVLATVLVLGTAVFTWTITTVSTGTPLGPLDNLLHQSVLGLQTPWATNAMVYVTQLGDWQVLWPLAAGVLTWTVFRRDWNAAGHWIAAVAFCMLASPLLKNLLQIPRPSAGVLEVAGYSFPSGHTLKVTVLYGFLAVMISRALRPSRRWQPYSIAGLVIAAVGLSRLYLGVHWTSDVVGGISLGLIWICALGMAYGTREQGPLGAMGLTLAALMSLAIASTLHFSLNHAAERERYVARQQTIEIVPQAWWGGDWRYLPRHRDELREQRNHPFHLQWAGPAPLIGEVLENLGWKPPPPLSASSFLLYLYPEQPISALPVLPHAHEGRHQGILWVKELGAGERRLVLRLWDSGYRLDHTPLWMGNVSAQRIHDRDGLFAYPQTETNFEAPLAELADALKSRNDLEIRRVNDASAERPIELLLARERIEDS